MYIPPHFAENNPAEIEALVRQYSFATVITVKDNIPLATHLPLHLHIDEYGQWRLHGHLARANPQWHTFSENTPVLIIFMGPHSYISPSWYNHRNVPTWNYLAVHIYGKATIVEGERVQQMLRQLMQHYEHLHARTPQGYDEIPSHMLDKDLKGLVAFEIVVEKVEAASKLSQNRDAESYTSVIEHLKQQGNENAERTALEMEKRKK